MSNSNLHTEKSQLTPVEKEFENTIRPKGIAEFSGQQQIIDNLKIFIKAAKMRSEALDHVLFHGPPGLGKTTLSRIVANELGVNIKETSGPVIEKPGDLAGLLTNLEPHDNGKGIDWNNQRAFSNGIQNLKKRMKEINGEVAFVNERGTKVSLTIPL